MAQDSALDIWAKHVEEGGLKALGSPVFTAPEAMSKEEEWLLLADMGKTQGAIEGFKEGGLMEAIPFANYFADGGVTDSKELDKAIKAVRAGTASQEQFTLIVDDMRRMSAPKGVGYYAAKGIKSTAAFGGEILLTGPAARLGSSLGAKAITTFFKAGGGRGAGLLARGSTAMAGEAARMAAIDSGKYGLDWLFGEGEAWSPADVGAFRRSMPEFQFGVGDDGRLQLLMTSVGEALTSKKFEARTQGYIELLSERLGPTLGGAFKKLPIGGKIMALEADLFRWMRGKGYSESLDELLATLGKKAEINSAIEEWMEDRASAGLAGATPWMEEELSETIPSWEEGAGGFIAALLPGSARAGLGRAFGQTEGELSEEKDAIISEGFLQQAAPEAPVLRARLEARRRELEDLQQGDPAIEDLTGETPTPEEIVEELAEIKELEGLSDGDLESRFRRDTAKPTQPGDTENVAQRGLDSIQRDLDESARQRYEAEVKKLVDGGASEEEAAAELEPRVGEFLEGNLEIVSSDDLEAGEGKDQDVARRWRRKPRLSA